MPDWMMGTSHKAAKSYSAKVHGVLPDKGCEPSMESDAETQRMPMKGRKNKPRKRRARVNIHGKKQLAYYWER